jgi:hypothetical protein
LLPRPWLWVQRGAAAQAGLAHNGVATNKNPAPREKKMKLQPLCAAAVLAVLAAPVSAAQGKPCEELRSEIDAKIRQNGVTQFTLTIVDKTAPDDGKVVGTCEGGSKKILYKRG